MGGVWHKVAFGFCSCWLEMVFRWCVWVEEYVVFLDIEKEKKNEGERMGCT